MTPTTRRAALYVRQSLDKAEGIERQIARTTQLAEARGWTVVATFEDNDVSASKPRGPATAWGRMLDAAKAKDFDVIVSVDVDRLIRSIQDLVTLIDLGVAVATVNGEVDLTTADGELRATMLAAVARFETRRKGERQRRANEYRAAKGNPMPTRRAFGWEPGGEAVRESEAKWVRWAYKEILQNGTSTAAIARRFNAEKVTTTTGQPWQTTRIRRMLERPRNAGIVTFKGEVVSESGNIPPLVSREDYDALLAVLSGRTSVTQRWGRNEDSWLSGLIPCVCGEPLTTKTQRRGKTTAGKERHYICAAKLRRNGTAASGRHVSITAHVAEFKVKGTLYGLYSGGWIEAESKTVADEARALAKALSDLNEHASELTGELTTPGVDKGVIRKALAEVAEQRDKVVSDLDRLRASHVEADWLTRLKEAGEDSAESADEFNTWFDSLTYDQKRNIAKTLSIEVKPGGRGSERVRVFPR